MCASACQVPEAAYEHHLIKRSLDPETVALLSRVLDESFMTLMNGTPVLDPEWRQGVRHRLAQVIIGARISKSGNAIAQSGDLQTLSAPLSNSRSEPVQKNALGPHIVR